MGGLYRYLPDNSTGAALVLRWDFVPPASWRQEFPLAAPQLQKLPDNHWLLKTEVCSYEGVGRFVLGLPGEIEIIESPEFFDYISRQINKMKNV